jgi:iron complex outermembrane receptor protein
MHKEAFVPDAFSTLKLRLGYGIVGNRDGLGYGNFVRRERAADVGINDAKVINNPGVTTQGFANQGLKWEETTQQTLGVDFGFLNERLYGSVDFYLKETKDLLLQNTAAQPAVNTVVFQNLDATVENKGWEFSLGFEAIQSNDVSLSITGNVSHNSNLLKDFGGNLNAGTIYGQGLSGAFAQQLAGGYPLFSFYLREFAGFDADGQPIRDNQKFVGKSALPVWNSGLSLNLKVGNFDMNAYLAGQFEFYVYNNTQNAFFTAGAINNGRNVTADVLTSGESGAAEAAVSERFLHRGDFIRLQNLSFGYNVPVSGAFKNLRFSLTAQNLFLITDYNGIDPEVSTQASNNDLLNNLPTAGIDWAAYPRPRVFTLGVNATF